MGRTGTFSSGTLTETCNLLLTTGTLDETRPWKRSLRIGWLQVMPFLQNNPI